ncbi:hypothetical protein [Photobacterium lutimaris]|uniref:Uncharacterized protein n=1 Tax=Photobacterium lutimaris TaxID=388278 RepID=A0A2T3ITP0_9GAMM|nr:hypothetical protein [Photobacterium lutimaris]PSU31713.1 hypothetical protein C9I99_21235 [Photobacterium lutimaris]TDR72648.1 hypothetical protein DFP78_113124 [Photobacterium lutimaris]
MSSTHHLYCPQTNEAVALLRSGGDGLSPDGDYSNQALFLFLAYHNALNLKECTFEMRVVTGGGKFENAHLVSSLYELDDKRDELEGLEDDPWFILLWEKNCVELLARNAELADNLSAYNFGAHALVTA